MIDLQHMKDTIENIKWEIGYWYGELVKSPIREVKWFIQRGRRGWADKDAWDMHRYLSSVIPDMLDKQIIDGVGYPMDMTQESWDKTRREIASGFLAWQLLDEDNWHDDTLSHKENQKRCKKAWAETQKSLDKSCKLLAKHFGNLWD